MIRVMIVEDDPMVAEINKRYLEKLSGFELVAMARTVNEAILMVEKLKMDLILLDIFMPGKQGIELLAYLRAYEIDTDVIVISAASDIERIKKTLRYGVVDYLIKPFEFNRFSKALTTYKEHSRFIQMKNVTCQEVLDQQFFHPEGKFQVEELPKGLSKDTFKHIWEALQKLKSEPFSTEDVVKLTGLSRVSVRKYLNFLSEFEILDIKVIYGAVGRPVYQHEFKELKEHIIEKFL
jgi:CitB family two-component system response regulator MalR